MADVKFTPGPWAVGYRAYDVTAADGQMKVCDIRGWGYLTGRGSLALSDADGLVVQTANANLIASSPDMYDALVGMLAFGEAMEGRHLVGDEGCFWPVEQARAAIAKAEGRS